MKHSLRLAVLCGFVLGFLAPPLPAARWMQVDFGLHRAVAGDETDDPGHPYFLLPPSVQEWLRRLGIVAQNRNHLSFRHGLSVVGVVHPNRFHTMADSEQLWYREGVRPGLAAIRLIPLSEGQVAFVEPRDFDPKKGTSRVASLPNGFLLRKFPCVRPEQDNAFWLRISGADEEEPFVFASLLLDAVGNAQVALEILPPAGRVLEELQAIEDLLRNFTNAGYPFRDRRNRNYWIPGCACFLPEACQGGERPRFDDEVRGTLHQVRQRFAKTLALGLTPEEWNALQRGEIPDAPEAREVIRQTAEEAGGEMLELMAQVWDRIADASPPQEAQARSWLQQTEALGTFSNRFEAVVRDAEPHSDSDGPDLADRTSSRTFLQSELSLAQVAAISTRVACYGVPAFGFLPMAGTLSQVVRAGRVIKEVVTTAVTAVVAAKFAKEFITHPAEESTEEPVMASPAGAVAAAPAAPPPGDDDSGSDDEAEPTVVASEGLYSDLPRGTPKGGIHRNLGSMKRYGYERHHLMCREACKLAGRADLIKNGPSVYVRTGHHFKTASNPIGKTGKARLIHRQFITKQAELLRQGKIREALAMGIKDLQSVESGYNGGIQQAMKAAKEAGFLCRGASGGIAGGAASGAVGIGTGAAVVGSSAVEGAGAPAGGGRGRTSASGNTGSRGADRDHDHSGRPERDRDRTPGPSRDAGHSAPEHASEPPEPAREPRNELHEVSEKNTEGASIGDGIHAQGHEVHEVHAMDKGVYHARDDYYDGMGGHTWAEASVPDRTPDKTSKGHKDIAQKAAEARERAEAANSGRSEGNRTGGNGDARGGDRDGGRDHPDTGGGVRCGGNKETRGGGRDYGEFGHQERGTCGREVGDDYGSGGNRGGGGGKGGKDCSVA